MSSYVTLPSRPDLVLAYQFEQIGQSTQTENALRRAPVLIVFVSGLLGAMTEWNSVIDLLRIEETSTSSDVFYLKFDRYGLGESKECNKSNQVQAYNLVAAARDLSELVDHVVSQEFKSAAPHIILVGHSVGVAIARLYINTTANPSIFALLSVDSTMTDTDFVTAFPDPDDSSFNAGGLPEGTGVQDLRMMLQFMKAIFHPGAPNDERLDRSDTQSLLPLAAEPKLKLSNGEYPYLTIMMNDGMAAAIEMQAMLGVRPELVMSYIVPLNKKYQEGLLGLSSPEKVKGPITAHGSGHWIHKDCPQMVSDELRHLIALS